MTYEKEVRDELMQQEVIEDKMNDIINEIKEGEFEGFLRDNESDLKTEFVSMYIDQFTEFTKSVFYESRS